MGKKDTEMQRDRERKHREKETETEMGGGWVEGKGEKRKRNKREETGRVQPFKGGGRAHVHKDHTMGPGTAQWDYAF